MTDTPTWLSDNDAPVADPGPPGGVYNSSQGGATAEISPGGVSVGETSTPASTSDEDDEKLPKMILFMRLANMAAAILIVTCSILKCITLPAPSAFVLAIYASCGGILICCLETQLKFLRVIIAVNFGFLFNSVWRFMFYLLLGSVAWSFNSLLGQITAGVMIGVAIFNTYVLCRYPTYRKMREKIAEEEDKKIEARISKEVKRQAARQLTGRQKEKKLLFKL